MTERTGFRVFTCDGVPAEVPAGALTIDVGADVPVALSGLREVARALVTLVPALRDRRSVANAAEWNVLFPDEVIEGRSLFEVADAPNQRRLFRESEQTFRVLTFAAHLIVDGARAIGRPLVLANVGACDLVSVRGLMHAVQCSRIDGPAVDLVLAGFRSRAAHASRRFQPTRDEHMARARRRMGAVDGASTSAGVAVDRAPRATLEGTYLRTTLDAGAPIERRLAAALLTIRACFFSTNHEGAMLAAETGLALLDGAATGSVSIDALLAAWDAQDDARFDIPMLELDRSSLVDTAHVRAQLLIHAGVIQVFTGDVHGAVATFGQALECDIRPTLASDVRLYRALVATKMLGDPAAARVEIEHGLAALRGRTDPDARTSEAWLHNLLALTHFQERDLDLAQREEELSLACIDHAPGPSAAHLKTNLVSNFSVVYEARGDLATATRVWSSFASLNAKLRSDAADKVFLNRLGALQREAGETEAALASYGGAFAKAEATGDRFHAEIIASAIARLHLERGAAGDGDEAARWYRTAAGHARYCGDCLATARDLAGEAIARGATPDFAEARTILEGDSTYERESASLRAALASGDAAVVLRELPRSKSKLSRPFALVNL